MMASAGGKKKASVAGSTFTTVKGCIKLSSVVSTLEIINLCSGKWFETIVLKFCNFAFLTQFNDIMKKY